MIGVLRKKTWGEQHRGEQLEKLTRTAVATESLRRIDQEHCRTADLWGFAVTLMASGAHRHVSVPSCESGASEGDTSCNGEEVDNLLDFASSLDYDKYLAECDCQSVIASGNKGNCGHGRAQRTSTTPDASSTPAPEMLACADTATPSADVVVARCYCSASLHRASTVSRSELERCQEQHWETWHKFDF